MANDDNIRARGGLLPVDFPTGNYKKTYYRLTTSAAAGVYLGQPMAADAGGRVTTLALANSSAVCIGTVTGFLDTSYAALPSAMETTNAGAYLPANTDAYLEICDDPFQDFVCQEDTGGSALTESNIFNNAAMIFRTSSGDTTTGYSTAELDRSSAGTGTGGFLMIKQIHRYMNSDGTANAPGNYCKWIVRITNHQFAPLTAPTGNQI